MRCSKMAGRRVLMARNGAADADSGSLAVNGLGLVVRAALNSFGPRPCPAMPDTRTIEPSAHG